MTTVRKASAELVTEKGEAVEELEHAPQPPSKSNSQAVTHGDAALAILGTSEVPIHITPEQDAAVLRKVDKWLVPVMLMVYFLQQLDKSSLSYTSVFGIVSDTNLVGSQYSWLGSIVYVAQLVWQPVSSYLLVRLPVGKYLFVNVFMWGVVVSCTAAAHNFNGLITTRFFLGIFEATVAPCFITITQMFGSLLAFGVGHIRGSIRPYQSIFLFIGLLTLVLSPIVYFVLPDSPTTAKFLSRDEKIVALERLRANNQGPLCTESKTWEWNQVAEVLLDPKTYLWFAMFFLCALPSGGISTFGPLILKGFGFNQASFHTILLNIPFGAFQVIVTVGSAAISTKIKLKWPVVFFLTLPPIAGAAALYVLGRDTDIKNKLLGCYYVLSFYTGIQPMLYTWASQNTAGHTKKTCTTGITFVGQCAGNIIGPLLYRTADAPYYHLGLISNLACWIALAVLTPLMALYLSLLNRRHAAARRRAGKQAEVVDMSLEDSKTVHQAAKLDEAEKEGGARRKLNDQAFNDLTDLRNEDFIYVL